MLTSWHLRTACAPWGIAPESLHLLGDTENFIYGGTVVDSGEACVLRITRITRITRIAAQLT